MFQEIFDLESLIWKANKLQRLDITFSLPAESVVSIDDISAHCGEELELVLPRTKSESSLSEVILDPSAFKFSHTSRLIEISESLGGNIQPLSDQECPTLTSELTMLNPTTIRKYAAAYLSLTASKLSHPSSSNFITPHVPTTPHLLLSSSTSVLVTLVSLVVPPRMENIFSPILLPAALHDLPSGYSTRPRQFNGERGYSVEEHLGWFSDWV